MLKLDLWEQKIFTLLSAVSEKIDRIYEKPRDTYSEESNEVNTELDRLEEEEFILKTVFELSIRFRTGAIIDSTNCFVRKGFVLVGIMDRNMERN